jgi:hypothetical protein
MTRTRTPLVALPLIGLLAVLLPLQPVGSAAPQFGEWGPPVNLGPVVNSPSGELSPLISKDGRSLYFSSNRLDSFGGEDLWVSTRSDQAAPWGSPVNLGAVINTGSNERSPALSRDGHYLFFASSRPGGLGGLDVYVSYRQHVDDDLGWEAPVNLGAPLNSASTDAGPAFFENDDSGLPQLFIASNRPGGAGGLDIYVSELLGEYFQAPTAVADLNTPQLDLTPGIRHDGLEIVIGSDRPGGVGGQDLWVATRDAVGDSWSSPVNLGAGVNSLSIDNFPSLSSDRKELYFFSDRAGGLGSGDLYVSRRPGRGE